MVRGMEAEVLNNGVHKEKTEQLKENEGRTIRDPQNNGKDLYEVLCRRQIIEHHPAFAEGCIGASIYPLGLKAFIPCFTYKADNTLRRQWKAILNKASRELLALLKAHFINS